jgi:nucleoside-diphosphate-sugar epimerase
VKAALQEPDRIETEEELESRLAEPTPELVADLRATSGDFLILGVGGKMGPSLAHLARRALDAAGQETRRVIGVARFSEPGLRERLEGWGIHTLAADLLAPGALESLPDAPNVIFMAARKFGSTGHEAQTWAMNTFLPGLVARRFSRSRIVAFSTGNVYPLVPVAGGGCTEQDPVGPVGEYAQSCLGRERMFEYGSVEYGTPVTLLRLNYAVELRYGVLLDIAQKVQAGAPIDLSMGYVNVIWQGDANGVALRAFAVAQSPPKVVNLTGPETLAVRQLAMRLGDLLGNRPVFAGSEGATALLNNAAQCAHRFGPPRVPVERVLRWVAHWVAIGGRTLNKPTKFQVRDGKF